MLARQSAPLPREFCKVSACFIFNSQCGHAAHSAPLSQGNLELSCSCRAARAEPFPSFQHVHNITHFPKPRRDASRHRYRGRTRTSMRAGSRQALSRAPSRMGPGSTNGPKILGTYQLAPAFLTNGEQSMPDDLTDRGPQDRSRISLLEPHEVQYWADKFNVSKERLSEAVRNVGHSADAVERELKRLA